MFFNYASVRSTPSSEMKKCFLVAMVVSFIGFTEQISLYKTYKLIGKTPELEREKDCFLADAFECQFIKSKMLF